MLSPNEIARIRKRLRKWDQWFADQDPGALDEFYQWLRVIATSHVSPEEEASFGNWIAKTFLLAQDMMITLAANWHENHLRADKPASLPETSVKKPIRKRKKAAPKANKTTGGKRGRKKSA